MHVACKNRLWNKKGLVYNIKEYLFVIYVQIRPIKKLSSIIVSTSPSLSSSLSSSSSSSLFLLMLHMHHVHPSQLHFTLLTLSTPLDYPHV